MVSAQLVPPPAPLYQLPDNFYHLLKLGSQIRTPFRPQWLSQLLQPIPQEAGAASFSLTSSSRIHLEKVRPNLSPAFWDSEGAPSLICFSSCS